MAFNHFVNHQQHRGSTPVANPYMINAASMAYAAQFSYPLSGIDHPGLNDVMCGRGGGTNNHIGNVRFRQLVNEHKLRYLAATKTDKPKVAMEVVQIWRALNPPGRFLTKTDSSLGDDSPWHDVGDKKAREKASQCLRERTPEVMPFVKQLQMQQQLEEQKKKEEEESEKKSQESGDNGGETDEGQAAKETEQPKDEPPSLTAEEAEALNNAVSDEGSKVVNNEEGDEVTENREGAAITKNVDKRRASAPVIESPVHVGSSKNSKTGPGSAPSTSAPSVASFFRTPSGRRRTTEEVGNAVPVAASLMEECFGEEDEDGKDEGDQELTQEEYEKGLEEFLFAAPAGDGSCASSEDGQSSLMETLSTTSWVRSFRSVGSGSTMVTSADSFSLRRGIAEETGDDNEEAPRQSDTFDSSGLTLRIMKKEAGFADSPSRSQKMNIAKGTNNSNISMMSDLTDMSGPQRSSRSMKINNAKPMSNVSMLSDMTDLSETMKDLGLK